MITLSHHIELLLLEHNCVIVPGLGGFIANTASAEYNDGPDGDKLFIPPYRTIGFNPKLQINDGLLVQSYMQAYDTSYPAAYLQMEKDVEQLNMQLNLIGEYNLDGIGTLHKSLGQNVTLTSSEAGILTPSLYGTYSFEIKNISEAIREREIQNAANRTNISPIQTETDFKLEARAKDENKDEHVVPIKRKEKNKQKEHHYGLDIAVAAAAAIVIFMTFLVPNIKSMNGENETYIAGYTNKNAYGKKPETHKVSEINKKQALKASEANPSIDKEESHTSTAVERPTKHNAADNTIKNKFTIVLASYVTETNSNNLIKDLEAQGIPGAKFVKNGQASHVIYSSYPSQKDAYDALAILRKQSSAFAEAWPMEMK